MFSVFIWPILFFSFTLIPKSDVLYYNTGNHEEAYSSLHSVRQHVFIKDKIRYLNVPRVGKFIEDDVFDCTFECLSNPLCFSVNLAPSKGAKEELWCELLSSDKYRNFTEYRGSQNLHRFIIQSPCSSSPCQNGGTCLPNYRRSTFECLCQQGFIGEDCKKVLPVSCTRAYNEYKSSSSQLITLLLDSKPISVLCHFGNFGCGDGAWTPVMKIDGNKYTFHYNSEYWSNKRGYNLPGGETAFDTRETKLPTYWNTSFAKICLGMKIGQDIKIIVINKQANSLHSLIADGQYRATSLLRSMWKSMIGPQVSLQTYCNTEGFNAANGEHWACKARIGILGNNNNDCATCNSRIGFGTGGLPDDYNTCGNDAVSLPDNEDKHIKAMGYILVQ